MSVTAKYSYSTKGFKKEKNQDNQLRYMDPVGKGTVPPFLKLSLGNFVTIPLSSNFELNTNTITGSNKTKVLLYMPSVRGIANMAIFEYLATDPNRGQYESGSALNSNTWRFHQGDIPLNMSCLRASVKSNARGF